MLVAALVWWSPSPSTAATPQPSKASSTQTAQPSKASTVGKPKALPTLPTYSGKKLQLKKLLKSATQSNPTLIRLRRWVAVYKQKEKQTTAWPDLQVGVQVSNFPLPTFDPTLTAMSGIQYTLSQKFPILKRLGLQRKMAQHTTAILQQDVREKTLWIHFQIRQIVYKLSYFREALQTNRELYALAGQMAEVARAKYAVGKARQQSYLQAWTLQSQIRNQTLGLLAQEKILRFQLARLVGGNRKVAGIAPTLKKQASSSNVSKLLQQAIKQRGILQRWRIAAQQSKTLLELARVKYYPDVTVQLGIRQRFPNPADQGNPFLTLGVKVALPTGGNSARYGLLKEAMARHQLAMSRQREAQTQIKEAIQIEITKIQQYQRQMEVFRTQVIPLALQTYRSTLSSYQVDRVGFLTLLSTLTTLYKEKLKWVSLRVEQRVSQARLRALSGQP